MFKNQIRTFPKPNSKKRRRRFGRRDRTNTLGGNNQLPGSYTTDSDPRTFETPSHDKTFYDEGITCTIYQSVDPEQQTLPPLPPRREQPQAGEEIRRIYYHSNEEDIVNRDVPDTNIKSPYPDLIVFYGCGRWKPFLALDYSFRDANYPSLHRKVEPCGRDMKVQIYSGDTFLAESVGPNLMKAEIAAISNIRRGLQTTNHAIKEKPTYLPRKKFPEFLHNVDPSLSYVFKVVCLNKPFGPAFPQPLSGAIHYVSSEDELWQCVEYHCTSGDTADLFILNIDKDHHQVVSEICRNFGMIHKPLMDCANRGSVIMRERKLRDIVEDLIKYGGENVRYRLIPPGSSTILNDEEGNNEELESGEKKPFSAGQKQDVPDLVISPWISDNLIILEVLTDKNELQTAKELIFQSVRDCPEFEEFIIEKKKAGRIINAEALIDRKVVGRAKDSNVMRVKHLAALNALENLKQYCYYIVAKRSYFGFHGDTLPEFLRGPNRINKTDRYRIVEPKEIKSESDVSRVLRQLRNSRLEDLFFLDDFALEERNSVMDLANQMGFAVRQFDRDCICVYKKNRPKAVFKELMELDGMENEKYKLIIPPKKSTQQETGLDQKIAKKGRTLQQLFDFNEDKKSDKRLYDEGPGKDEEGFRSSGQNATSYDSSSVKFSCLEGISDTDNKNTNEILQRPSRERGHCYGYDQQVTSRSSGQQTLPPWIKNHSHDQRPKQEIEKQEDKGRVADCKQHNQPPWIRESASKMLALFDTGSESVAFQTQPEQSSEKEKESANKMFKLFDTSSNSVPFQRQSEEFSGRAEGSSSTMTRRFEPDSRGLFDSKERKQVDYKPSSKPPWIRDSQRSEEPSSRISSVTATFHRLAQDSQQISKETSNKTSSLFGSGPFQTHTKGSSERADGQSSKITAPLFSISSNKESYIRPSPESHQNREADTNKLSKLFDFTSNSKSFQISEQPQSKLFNKLFDRSASARKERLEMERQAERSSNMDQGRNDNVQSQNYRFQPSIDNFKPSNSEKFNSNTFYQSRDNFLPSHSENFNRNTSLQSRDYFMQSNSKNFQKSKNRESTSNQQRLWNQNIKQKYDQIRPY